MKVVTYELEFMTDGARFEVAWSLPVISRMFDAQAFERDDGAIEMRRPVWNPTAGCARMQPIVIARRLHGQR